MIFFTNHFPIKQFIKFKIVNTIVFINNITTYFCNLYTAIITSPSFSFGMSFITSDTLHIFAETPIFFDSVVPSLYVTVHVIDIFL